MYKLQYAALKSRMKDDLPTKTFLALETEGSAPYMNSRFASGDSHPNSTFSRSVAPCVAQRIIDVIEGCGDTSSILGS